MLSFIQAILDVSAAHLSCRNKELLESRFKDANRCNSPSAAFGPTSLALDKILLPRLLGTVERDLLITFDRCTRRENALTQADWSRLVDALEELHDAVRMLVRTGDQCLVGSALRAQERTHRCQFVLGSGIEQRMAPELNLVVTRTVGLWKEVAQGLEVVQRVLPTVGPLLPLTSIWGHAIEECHALWSGRRRRGYSAMRKTQAIAYQMSQVLGRCPVECMSRKHVEQFVENLRRDGNAVTTVQNKLGLLAGMVRPFAPPEANVGLADLRLTRTVLEALRQKRQPLSEEQLGKFLGQIFRDQSLRNDDRVVVALTALSVSRIDEIASLETKDLEWDGECWLIKITLSAEEMEAIRAWLPEGTRLEGLKGPASKRTIPLYADTVPGLHERLLELSNSPGALFKHLTKSVSGGKAAAIGQRINRRVRECFGEDCPIVFESLRNTGSPKMRRAGIDHDVRRVFLGHAPLDLHGTHYEGDILNELKKAARAMADVIGDALEGQEVPRLDIPYDKVRRCLKRNRAVPDVQLQACPVQ